MSIGPNKAVACVAVLLLLQLAWSARPATAEDADWKATQQALDAACESARAAHLSVDRAKYVDECVATKLKENRAACERFYADYGSRTATRPPLYYDLPECQRAFEHQHSQRSPTNGE